jgi:hypothetical protein
MDRAASHRVRLRVEETAESFFTSGRRGNLIVQPAASMMRPPESEG